MDLLSFALTVIASLGLGAWAGSVHAAYMQGRSAHLAETRVERRLVRDKAANLINDTIESVWHISVVLMMPGSDYPTKEKLAAEYPVMRERAASALSEQQHLSDTWSVLFSAPLHSALSNHFDLVKKFLDSSPGEPPGSALPTGEVFLYGSDRHGEYSTQIKMTESRLRQLLAVETTRTLPSRKKLIRESDRMYRRSWSKKPKKVSHWWYALYRQYR